MKYSFLLDFIFTTSEKAKGICKEKKNLFNSWDDEEHCTVFFSLIRH